MYLNQSLVLGLNQNKICMYTLKAQSQGIKTYYAKELRLVEVKEEDKTQAGMGALSLSTFVKARRGQRGKQETDFSELYFS